MGWMDDYLLELRNCRIGAKPDWGAEEKKGGARFQFGSRGWGFDLISELHCFCSLLYLGHPACTHWKSTSPSNCLRVSSIQSLLPSFYQPCGISLSQAAVSQTVLVLCSLDGQHGGLQLWRLRGGERRA